MSNQNVVQINLQNNLREVADLIDSRISSEETRVATIMRTRSIPRQHRQMALWFSQMMDRLENIDNLLNAYLALVLYRRPPDVQSRRLQQAYRLYTEVNMWQNYPGIVRKEHHRLTELSDRLDELKVRVRHLVVYLRSLP